LTKKFIKPSIFLKFLIFFTFFETKVLSEHIYIMRGKNTKKFRRKKQ